eukprot:5021973-Amphidinium_carterae.1
MCEIFKGVWETLRQPSLSAERTRRCQTENDELWLSEELAGLSAEGDTFGISASKRLKMATRLFRQIACRRTCVEELFSRGHAGRRNCPVLTRKTSPGRAWVLRGAHWPFKLGLSLRTGGVGL